MAGSLAYRTHAAEIHAGRVPAKYSRLLPYISGRSILELGAAEGVLALLLADRDPAAIVTALERRPDRYAAARELQAAWRARGMRVDRCCMVCGDIRDPRATSLLFGVDALVAIRMIYYLGDDLARVFATVASHVPTVVLGGNANRARQWAAAPDSALGRFNFYASVEGMSQVLTAAGYTIATVVREGDPLVIGRR
jgi:hypothetical protein